MFTKTPVRENCTPGSARGLSGDWQSYRDPKLKEYLRHWSCTFEPVRNPLMRSQNVVKSLLIAVFAICFCQLAVHAQAALPEPGATKVIQESGRSTEAKALWEQAIISKGGRDQLYSVNSLVLSYRETVRNFLGITVHRGIVETLYVFPDKLWGWDDGLPPPFHLSILSVDLERNVRCVVSGSGTPACGPAKQRGSASENEGLLQAQYLYLMETRWVRPIPVEVTKSKSKFDVLHTRLGGKRIDYFLDRKTHLPMRVVVFNGSGDRPTLRVEFSNYVRVGAIQMPGKQKRTTISFQINPTYDENIFTRLPSLTAGPHAWQRSRE